MLRSVLPGFIKKILFGDREKFGLVPKKDDCCWLEWEKSCYNFYLNNQKKTIGKIVNDAGYRVLKKIDWSGKKVLEIGPGEIAYLDYIPQGNTLFYLVDIRQNMLDKSSKKIKERGFGVEATHIEKGYSKLPFSDESFDVVISFYSLEHIYPLEPYLMELKRVLKTGGILVGAIPLEGGLAWGLGRFFTSRRWFKKNTTIDPDKIICWEHPNFADEIRNSLEKCFGRGTIKLWPFPFLLPRDFNLIEKFIFRKGDVV
ncbi:MAG TPA: hypothetical protein DEG23_01765 [Coxiellaceae bacterium]|nr:hypothetical protein [Coxiellaceae bacterium]